MIRFHRPRVTGLVPSLILAAAMSLSACGGGGGHSGNGGASPESAPVADTAQGPVSGKVTASQYQYLGIPYAAPPVGDLRFAPPAAPADHSAPLAATDYGSPCPQGGGAFGTPSSNEDCLYLNVYRPKGDGPYPVMVWIHGGAFVTGSGGATYDPARLVAQGLVVVTINYRLGILGFLAHPALTAESGTSGSGDYGLMDQQAALRWVNANIGQFAGDAGNITVFGESAGGHSVLSLLASPEAAGLFEKAIVESGSYQPDQLTLAQAETAGQAYANGAGCTSTDNATEVACLRALSVSEILTVQGDHQFVPNTRPGFLPKSIATTLSDGSFNQVPVMAGTNRDEWRLFVALDELASGNALQAADYQSTIESTLGVDSTASSAIAAEYPVGDYANPSVAMGAVGTDAIFACNALNQAAQLSAHVTTYAYEFADRDAPPILPAVSFDYGAAHAFEISYVLSSSAGFQGLGTSADQLTLSNTMVGYWSRFAKTGDPNGGGDPAWTAFGSSSPAMISLEAPTPQSITPTAFDSEHHCSTFWAALL